ncbi:hypothetical protein QQZ08_004044 [Neonectria magnoliae]|uniref:Uncharacterized protein n=1 Tax=Neonectria magnoliae TaxID=2732573 RepID=A0ABR1I9G7_9HYPO
MLMHSMLALGTLSLLHRPFPSLNEEINPSPNLTTILITAALVEAFLLYFCKSHPRQSLLLSCNLSNDSSKTLADLPKAENSRLILVKLDIAIESGPDTAVETLRKEHGIESLDVVVVNAGISKEAKLVKESSVATVQLLKASKSGRPTFVAITSLFRTIGDLEYFKSWPPILGPYGASKAALNWFMRRIHFEEGWLINFVLSPGLVQTHMAQETFTGNGVDASQFDVIMVEQSATDLAERITTATKENGGTFRDHDGKPLPW